VSLVVTSQSSCLCCNSVEDVVDEVVHDHHGLSGNSSVWVDLLQHLVDVGGVGVGMSSSLLSLLASSLLLLGCSSFLCCGFAWHVVCERWGADRGRERALQMDVVSLLLLAGGSGGIVLGDCLGSFRNGMFGKFSRQNQSDCSLDFTTGDCVSLVVTSKSSCFGGNSVEDVVDEVVHNNHGLSGDTSVRVHLLQNFVDVRSIRVGMSSSLLSLVSSLLLLGCSSFLCSGFTRHDD
jgi:hypothetical protein